MSYITIDQTVAAVAFLLLCGLVISLLIGLDRLATAKNLPFYALRRRVNRSAWRFFLIGSALGLAGLAMTIYGREAAYAIIPPTPSSTPTATITLTPSQTLPATITNTPTITLTPTITKTATMTLAPTVTRTPKMPEALTVLFRETVTPDPLAAIGRIQVSDRIEYPPPSLGQAFVNPEERLYGLFEYDRLDVGVRWTAIWYFRGREVCVDTMPWGGARGGWGFTECTQETWLPGEYEIQFFVGEIWKVSARFTVIESRPVLTETQSP